MYPTYPALKVTKHRAAGCLSRQRGLRYPSHLHTPNTPGKHWPNSIGRTSILPLSTHTNPPLPFPGNSHFREEPAALRNRAASCPPSDRGGSSGSSLSKKRGWDRQAGRPPGSLPRGRSRGGGGGPAYLLLPSSWVSSGWVFCPSRPLLPDSPVWEAPDFCLTKFRLGGGCGRPPGPPGPAALGAGAGRGL